MTSCNHINSRSSSESNSNLDHLTYLEDVESDKSMEFVKRLNDKTLRHLQNQSVYANLQKEIFSIHTDKEKAPHYFFIDQDVYYFWQDDQHIKGQLRHVHNILDSEKKFTIILDLDVLAKTENKNWNWSGLECLDNNKNHCLILLSDGGKDAHVGREFNLLTQKFVENGFYIPESKSSATWIDQDTLALCDATRPDHLTASGYPREIRIWRRNQKLSQSDLIFSTPEKSLSAEYYLIKDQGLKFSFILDQQNFFNSKKYYIPDLGYPDQVVQIDLPESSQILDVFNNQLIIRVRDSFIDSTGFNAPAGSIISFSMSQIASSLKTFQLLSESNHNHVISSYRRTQNRVLISYMQDVSTKMKVYNYVNNWTYQDLPFKNQNFVDLEILATSTSSELFMVNQMSFLLPPEIVLFNSQNAVEVKTIYQGHKKFNSDNLTVTQMKVKSLSDGVEIPYFLIHKKNLTLSDLNPTILYGYGGFELSRTPYYMSVSGKAWLEKGGVYALANIRGGGEYGPEWHKAALKENRQKAFDDFYSVAQDLINQKITSPKHLGIWGGSNGGLLTSVAFTQRPDLFNAVIAEVPLANMMRYHKLLAGASWIAEYGNPDISIEREYILKYSPLQNLKPNRNYPEVLFITSTKDDRVHPAHARQMAARMQELGYSVLFYENINGGHKRASDPYDTSIVQALEYTYLWEKLK